MAPGATVDQAGQAPGDGRGPDDPLGRAALADDDGRAVDHVDVVDVQAEELTARAAVS
jgi:hypothetical protein